MTASRRALAALALAVLTVVGPTVPAHADDVSASGTISGQVLAPVVQPDGSMQLEPWQQTQIQIYSAPNTDPVFATTVLADTDGRYSLDVPDGTYTVCFRPRGGYLYQCAGGAYLRSRSSTVTVDGDALTVNETLVPSASISGTISDAVSGASSWQLETIAVPAGASVGAVPTADDSPGAGGAYRLAPLVPGDYLVEFAGPESYRTAYYAGPGQTTIDLEQARPIHVDAGQAITGLDGTIAYSPSHFTDLDGDPFAAQIAALGESGVLHGWADGTFRPGEPVHRDAMAAFLYRLAHSLSTGDAWHPAFRDATAIGVLPGDFPSPFFDEIEWAHAVGIAEGYPDGTFRPQDPISRDAMAAFLYRAAGSPAFTPPATPTFRDVTPQNDSFFTEIEWMAANHITTGYPDGTYRPQAPVARDAMAAFLARFPGRPPAE